MADPIANLAMAATSSNSQVQSAAGIALASQEAAAEGELDESAAPLTVEQVQLSGGVVIPGDGPRLEREYIWGPGDGAAGVDELFAQFDVNRKPWWVLQDAGGDIVALCDNSGSVGGAAFVAAQWTYDAYGSVFSADHLTPHPFMHAGHKGLFFDRLDVGVADAVPGSGGGVGASQSPRLVPFAHALIHNRNRAYNPQFGRFMQADPNASGMGIARSLAFHGSGNTEASVDELSVESRFVDGAGLYCYLGARPWDGRDPLGLFVLPSPGDMISGALEALVTEYSDRMSYDLEWAGEWEAGDDWHTRNDSLWVYAALGRGLHGSFDIFGFNPLGDYEGGDGPQLTAMVPGGRFGAGVRKMYQGMGKLHHIATVYGEWGVKFQVLFRRAGIEMNDALNAFPLPKHRGPHPQKYHEAVFERLKRAIGSKTGDAAKAAFSTEMVRLRRDLATGKLEL